MAEIVDYLLICWTGLGIVVYLFAQIFDKQQQQQQRPGEQHTRASRAQQSRTPNSTNLDDFSSWQRTSTSSTAANAPAATSRKYADYSPVAPPVSWPAGRYNEQQQQRHSAAYSSGPLYHDRAGAYHDPYGGSSGDYGAANQYGAYYQQQGDQYNARTGTGAHVASDNAAGLRAAAQQVPSASSCGSIPTATGFNADSVDWVNNILYLFYTQPQKYAPIIAESVYRSLNEKLSNITHSSGDYSHLIIEFTNINRDQSTRPELTNVRTEIESDKSISACSKLYLGRLSLELSVQQLYGGLGAASACAASAELQADFFGHNRPAQYELILENLEGKLKSMAMLSDKLIVVQFMEKPDTKITLRPVSEASYAYATAQQASSGRRLIADDTLVQIILQALTQVVVDLYFGHDVDFPQFVAGIGQKSSFTTSGIKTKLSNILRIGSGGASELKRQIKQDFFGSLSSGDQAASSNKRVFVKLIQANNINYNQNVTALLELDAPQQLALSSTRPASSNPQWDSEHFLFQLSEKTRELSVQLWDGISPEATTSGVGTTSTKRQGAATRVELTAGAKFLGQTRLVASLDELRRNPVQRLSLALQPLQNNSPPLAPLGDLSNSVGGELALELLYLENVASQSPSPSPSPSPTPSAAGPNTSAHHGTRLTKSTSSGSLGVAASYSPGDVVSIDRKLTPSGYVITTTTITKPPATTKKQRQQQQQQQQQHKSTRLGQLNASLDELASGGGGAKRQGRADTPAGRSSATAATAPDARSEGAAESLATRSMGRGNQGSLRRSRSRSLLRAIKKRFSFSRTRSRSLGPNSNALVDELGAQSGDEPDSPVDGSVTPASARVGADGPDFYAAGRVRTASESSAQFGMGHGARAKSMPTQRDPNEVPTIVINRGRLSDTASALTFTHPKSQLVIEVREPTLERENGGTGRQRLVTRHYAVPEQEANKRKWTRRGIKLHLFNEHQFVACHLAGSSTCHLCGRVFSRRPGKQGYKCRNCHLLSHKQCHVKVDHNCPYSAGNELKLEFIDADPPSELAQALTAGQLAGTEHYEPEANRRTLAKSISLETSGDR